MKTTVTRLRLDQHLHEAGLFDSREKAQRAILAGQAVSYTHLTLPTN